MKKYIFTAKIYKMIILYLVRFFTYNNLKVDHISVRGFEDNLTT